MITPPNFASISEYVSRLGDVGFWWPYVAEILERHDLLGVDQEPTAGFNPTYPTFLCGDVVVKLFGYSRSWRASHAAESAARRAVATDLEIAAPRLLGFGFILTVATIWLIPLTADTLGWRWVFVLLAPGPALGVLAMLRLKSLPESAGLAGGVGGTFPETNEGATMQHVTQNAPPNPAPNRTGKYAASRLAASARPAG